MITKERLIEEIGLRLQRLPNGVMKDRAIEAHEDAKDYGWVHTVIGVDLLHIAERIEQGYAIKYAFNWRANGTFDEWDKYCNEHINLLSGPIEEQPKQTDVMEESKEKDMKEELEVKAVGQEPKLNSLYNPLSDEQESKLIAETLKKSIPTYGEWGDMPLDSTEKEDEFSVFKLTYKNRHEFQVLHNNAAKRLTRFESGMSIQEFKFPMKYFPQISEMLKEVL